VLNNNGDSVILYLRKAPSTDPAAKNTNSKPFIILIFVLLEIISVI